MAISYKKEKIIMTKKENWEGDKKREKLFID